MRRGNGTQLLQRLHAVRRDFSPGAAAAKLDVLAALPLTMIRGAGALRRLHDDLLFLLAFPDSDRGHAAAARELARVPRRVSQLPAARRAALEDSGIPGTRSRHVFVHGIARWLAERHPTHAVIDWASVDDRDALDALLMRLMTRVESDAAESEALDTRAWARTASRGTASDLAWLTRQLARAVPAAERAAVYDAASVPIRWSLAGSSAGAAQGGLAHAPVPRTGLRGVPARPRAVIAERMGDVVLATREEAGRVIDAARGALAARCREVHAITYANPAEVYLADLGEGVRLAVIGVEPALRMGLEANYGYVTFATGVAIGYGGVSPLLFDANTGINVFESFRGSEAGFLWVAMLRAFRTLFNTTRFIVNPYQFGQGNDEAIDSGAFWFYYRLGFRPARPDIRRLAAKEFVRLAGRRRHRSDRDTLRRLAAGDLHLVMKDFRPEAAIEEAWLGRLAMAVAARIAREGSERRVAIRRIASRLAVDLGVRGGTRWPVAEQRAFADLAPLVGLVPDLRAWSARQRAALVDVLRAKGGPQERRYVHLAQRHRRFIAALRRAAGGS